MLQLVGAMLQFGGAAN